MKHNMVMVIFCVSSMAAMAADLIVPRTTTEQLNNEPLNTSAMAYSISEAGNAADLSIGGEHGERMNVIDRTGIHGYREKMMADDEFITTCSDGFTFDPTYNIYTLDTTTNNTQFGVTNWIKVTAASDVLLKRITRTTVNHASDTTMDMPIADIWEEHEGNVFTIFAVWNVAIEEDEYTHLPRYGTVSIADIVAYKISLGSPWTNNLNTMTFETIDSIGRSQLGKWREWAKNYTDRNNYQNWALAPATNSVVLNGNSVIYDTMARWKQFAEPDKMTIQAGGLDAMVFDFHGSSVTGTLEWTQFDINIHYITNSDGKVIKVYEHDNTNDLAHCQYRADIDGFDSSNLVFQESEMLTTPINWKNIPSSRILNLTDHSFDLVVDEQAPGTHFYRMVYDEFTAAVMTVMINGQLYVSGDIMIGDSTLTHLLAQKADRGEIPAIDPTNPAFSNAVVAVGLGIDTNQVAALAELAGLPIGESAGTVGGLLLLLVAAVLALKRGKADGNKTYFAAGDGASCTGVDEGEIVGGTVLAVGNERIVTWTGAGSIKFPGGVTSARVLAIGGGGGGGGGFAGSGQSLGGGGGGGGQVSDATVAVTPSVAYAVTVGAGGAGGAFINVFGQDGVGAAGGTSSFGALVTAIGGGGGGCATAKSTPGVGGDCGSGEYAGGRYNSASGGGGGGAGAVGSSNANGGVGGDGVAVDELWEIEHKVCAGGGGGCAANVTSKGGAGGEYGGGAGSSYTKIPTAGSYYGAGGGGGNGYGATAADHLRAIGGKGADGLVIIRYTLPPQSPSGIAIGQNAKSTAAHAMQIGEGTNDQPMTVKFHDWTILDATGKIPQERLPIDTLAAIKAAISSLDDTATAADIINALKEL